MSTGEEIRLPDFFLAGAARAGTTTVSYLLNEHPQIYLSPIKEPHYFAKDDLRPDLFRDQIKKRLAHFDLDKYLKGKMDENVHRFYLTDWSQYLTLFKNANAGQRIGEASPSYLWAAHAAEKIKEKIPDSQIIIMLRNPAERAFSHYLLERKMNLTSKNFSDDLKNDLNRRNKTWASSPMYVELGMYYEQVKRYLDTFGKEKVFIGLFEDMERDTNLFMQQIYHFLELSDNDLSGKKKHQFQSVLPRNKWLGSITNNMALKNFIKKNFGEGMKNTLKKIVFSKSNIPPMNESDRIILQSFFKEDILKLQDLIGRDLTGWLEER